MKIVLRSRESNPKKNIAKRVESAETKIVMMLQLVNCSEINGIEIESAKTKITGRIAFLK